MLLAACGESAGPKLLKDRSLDLLRGSPDATVSQPGILEPDPVRQWGDLGYEGWQPSTEPARGGDELPYVWSRDRTSTLLLPTGTVHDRSLRVVLFGPPHGEEPAQNVRIRLNGVELASRSLPDAPEEIELSAPAALWIRGNNLLELDVDHLTSLPEGRRVGLAVARVAYDAPADVFCDPARERLRLEPGTAVTYDFETLSTMQILLSGQAKGEGRLLVRLDAIDPATGEVSSSPFSSDQALTDEPAQLSIGVDELHGSYARLEISWSSADVGSGLSLSSLRRVDTAPPKRMPVIFVSMDTLSALHLPFYGYERDTAPHLAELVADSVLFENCRPNATWTVPSYMSLFSGLYAFANRLPEPPPGHAPQRLWDRYHLAGNRWTMAEMFHAAGYDTAAFVDHEWLTDPFGFEQGFETFDDEASRRPPWKGGIRLVCDKALDWLQTRTSEDPFFLFLHGLDVHGPYVPRQETRGRFADDGLYDTGRTAPVGGPDQALGIIPQYQLGNTPFANVKPPTRLPTAPLREAYDEGILYADLVLGRFLDDLKTRGLYDSAVIVFSADHGEMTDEGQSLFTHGPIDEPVTRVPLIVHLPGGRGGGQRIATTVQLVDVYATFVDLLGFAPRPWMHGHSLLPLIDHEEEGPRTAYIDGAQMDQQCVVRDGWKLVVQNKGKDSAFAFLLTQPGLATALHKQIQSWRRKDPQEIRQLAKVDPTAIVAVLGEIEHDGLTRDLLERLKKEPFFDPLIRLLRASFREEVHLYDLRHDPSGQVDVAQQHPDVVRRLRPLLEAEQARMEKARARAQLPSQPVELSPEVLSDLQALGYADD